MTYKLGSLFDGSGGFPLAGALCGIEPVWAAEVEPYPIAVTRSRFPNMKHLGDISKVNGADIEPVDIITFGSPCQDLSVAGKRAGLKHEANGDEETTRSGLFMEAVRIIKEMRKATNGQYPRFALWENVPGAFSSNKGEDFRIVCEELIKIVEPSAFMPSVPQNGWNYADSYVGDGWSLAYRVFDAQYWGVPQRRRRIHLVTDFRGECAREILFEREGLRGYFAEGKTPWQTTPTDAQGSTGADDRSGDTTGEENSLGGGGLLDGRRTDGGRQLDDVGFINAIGGNAENSQVTDTAPTLTNGTAPGFQNAVAYGVTTKGNGDAFLSKERHTALSTGGGQAGQGYPCVAYTMKIRSGCDTDASGKSAGKGALIQTDKAATLSTVQDQYLFQPVNTHIIDNIGGQAEYGKASVVNGTLRAGAQGAIAYSVENHPADSRVDIDESGKVQTLTSRMGTGGGKVANTRNTFDTGDARATELVVEEKPVICLQGNGIDRADTAGCNGKGWKEDTCYTLNTIDRPAVAYGLDRASFNQGQNAKFDFSVTEESQPCLTARGPGAVVHASKASFFTRAGEGAADTLVATDYEDPQIVAYEHHPRYIVRRLTPTECARLQGFADDWGRIEHKKTLTDEEYQFWCDVRNTHAAINGKRVQEYTKRQMLLWYNKLYTDSAEYKMWGNGIALPTALYVVQGMAEALSRTIEEEDWML